MNSRQGASVKILELGTGGGVIDASGDQVGEGRLTLPQKTRRLRL